MPKPALLPLYALWHSTCPSQHSCLCMPRGIQHAQASTPASVCPVAFNWGFNEVFRVSRCDHESVSSQEKRQKRPAQGAVFKQSQISAAIVLYIVEF
ncbi:hypothetical protein BgiMline_011920 [Biomphalaria glabrata]|nr:hypothetical protein BgiMline_030527 [Biomphalaria glabrata]